MLIGFTHPDGCFYNVQDKDRCRNQKKAEIGACPLVRCVTHHSLLYWKNDRSGRNLRAHGLFCPCSARNDIMIPAFYGQKIN